MLIGIPKSYLKTEERLKKDIFGGESLEIIEMFVRAHWMLECPVRINQQSLGKQKHNKKQNNSAQVNQGCKTGMQQVRGLQGIRLLMLT